MLGTCAGCSRVLSEEARYVSVSFDSFFASEAFRGKMLGFVLVAAAVIISTRTTARLLHDLLSLRRFKFIDWKEFVGTGRERKDCSLLLFVWYILGGSSSNRSPCLWEAYFTSREKTWKSSFLAASVSSGVFLFCVKSGFWNIDVEFFSAILNNLSACTSIFF